MKNPLNLYTDESGSAAIYKKDYKFFLMTSIIATEKDERRTQKKLEKWRKKYLRESGSSCHAADYFEDHLDKKTGKPRKFRKKVLDDLKIFKQATKELFNIVTDFKFVSKVAYVNLAVLRRKLGLETMMHKEHNHIKDVINNEYRRETLYPIVTVSSFLYKHHEDALIKPKRKKQGFVFYESQKENDVKLVESFHQHVNKNNKTSRDYIYGRSILGLSFVTKRSLCAGVEIADLIAYTNTQLLRLKYSKKELVISKERLETLLEEYKNIKAKFSITVKDLTEKCIKGMKEIKTEEIRKKTKKAS